MTVPDYNRNNTELFLIDAKDASETLQNVLQHLLVWGNLTPDERDRITRAKNAADIAYDRLHSQNLNVKPNPNLL